MLRITLFCIDMYKHPESTTQAFVHILNLSWFEKFK